MDNPKKEREQIIEEAFDHWRDHHPHPDPEDVERDLAMLEEVEKITKKGVHPGAER